MWPVPWTPQCEYPTVYLTFSLACITGISVLTCLNSDSQNMLPIQFPIPPKVTSILPFFLTIILGCHPWLLSFFFSFSFLFHSLLENTDSSMFYIKLNTYFCISIWKNLFITKWFSYHLPGPISSSFLTWIITVASESTTFIHNPLMSIFIISPRWIFSKLKLHHIPCCSKLPCHITC